MHDPERVPLQRFLNGRVGSENINLPTLRSSYTAQRQNNPGNAAIPRIADNVQDPHSQILSSGWVDRCFAARANEQADAIRANVIHQCLW